MENDVYDSSLIWSVLSRVSDITYFFGPWLIFVGTLIWAIRLRTWPGYVALAGGVLIAGGHLTHSLVPMVRIGENPVVVFLHLYGISIGLFALSVALLGQFLQRRTVA